MYEVPEAPSTCSVGGDVQRLQHRPRVEGNELRYEISRITRREYEDNEHS